MAASATSLLNMHWFALSTNTYYLL